MIFVGSLNDSLSSIAFVNQMFAFPHQQSQIIINKKQKLAMRKSLAPSQFFAESSPNSKMTKSLPPLMSKIKIEHPLIISSKPSSIVQSDIYVSGRKLMNVQRHGFLWSISMFIYNLLGLVLGFVESIAFGVYVLVIEALEYTWKHLRRLWVRGDLLFLIFVILFILLMMPCSTPALHQMFTAYCQLRTHMMEIPAIESMARFNESCLTYQCIY